MKKLIASIALGTLLVGGFFFSQDNASVDTAMEVEPDILSISNSTF
ncbi:hypothetical protein VBD025_00925 [Virgibacillus flavescens]